MSEKKYYQIRPVKHKGSFTLISLIVILKVELARVLGKTLIPCG